jgi:putative polyketide hydroxylase
VSTLDLLGPGLTLFTGPHSIPWEAVAAAARGTPPVVARRLSAITARTIGIRGGGALLSRPDGAPASSFARASAPGDGTFVRGVLPERERGSKRTTEAA